MSSFLEFLIGSALVIGIWLLLIREHGKLKRSIEKLVRKKLEDKGFVVVNIVDAHKDKKSPFYKERFNLIPITSREMNLFSHRIYKVELKNEEGVKMNKWIDCLYFLKYNCWFVIEDDEPSSSLVIEKHNTDEK